jgi:NADPH2:quinone reductase
MRALEVVTLEGPGAMELRDRSDSERADDLVLVEVKAAGVTFPDVLLIKGEYQIEPKLPFVAGSEIAGTVLSAPADAAVKPGDRVAGFPGLGGFAEKCLVATDKVFALPD